MTRTSACKLSRSLPKRSQTEGGFTLLEILLVLAILGMASIIVFPNLSGLESRTFGAQVREANSLLNYARRIAVVSGQPATATFYVATMQDDEANNGDRSATVGRWRGDGVALSYKDSAEQESSIEESIDISFFPEGGSTGGTLLLQFEERTASIVVDPFTGRVTVEFLDEE